MKLIIDTEKKEATVIGVGSLQEVEDVLKSIDPGGFMSWRITANSLPVSNGIPYSMTSTTILENDRVWNGAVLDTSCKEYR